MGLGEVSDMVGKKGVTRSKVSRATRRERGPERPLEAAPDSPVVFGLSLAGWLGRAQMQGAERPSEAPEQDQPASPGSAKGATRKKDKGTANSQSLHGEVWCLAKDGDFGKLIDQAMASLPGLGVDWYRARLLKRRSEPVLVPRPEGPLWLLALGGGEANGEPDSTPAAPAKARRDGGASLRPGTYGGARDAGATLATAILECGLTSLTVKFVGSSRAREEQLGLLVGLELGAYRYRSARAGDTRPWPALELCGFTAEALSQAAPLASGVNLARHLVNLPPCDLTPQSFAATLIQVFEPSPTLSVTVWEGDALAAEGMGLLAAVGQGATHGPRLVRLAYRPKGKAGGKSPLAIVGKGITFDSGGLDLKDAASMRLMKKDMGGAASVVGLAYWLQAAAVPVPVDFYLALAENAVDALSFHPGDVLTSRLGLSVEIDNTDAEGRLVLADAIDMAVRGEGTAAKGRERSRAPDLLIDLATLTGAMRVALGTRIAGMFSSDEELAADLLAAAAERGEPAWRMPLYGDYAGQLKSSVADLANSGPSRFGGAISAALFLKRFVGDVPWAHFDMYAWADGIFGGCQEIGGSGQCVQLLARFLERRAELS